MSNSSDRTDVDTLLELPDDELTRRMEEASLRVETRQARAYSENRDLTKREFDLTMDDKSELESLMAASTVKDQRKRRVAVISEAVEQRQRDMRGDHFPLVVSPANLQLLDAARRQYRSFTCIEDPAEMIHTRAAVTTGDMGTATQYSSNVMANPRTLWRASAIPTTEPPSGYTAVVPTFTLDAAAALVSEGAPHAEYDNVAPDSVTLKRAGKWSDLTSEAQISSSTAELSAAHSRLVARDIDLATVTKLEDTPGALGIDTALATVAGECGVDTSELWIFGDAEAVASLAGNATFSVTNAGDVASYASVYGAARLYVTPTASADQLTVFWPGGFRAFATRMASGVVVDPTTGSVRFGQWMIYGVGQALTGANVTVSLGGS